MKKIHDLIVVKKKILNKENYILELKAPEKMPEILPGQFVEVMIDGAKDVFLRRPLSVHDVDVENNTISLYIKIMGKGTEKLSHINEGESLNMIYPLGNSFTMDKYKKVLLIGGGCGVAPMLYLSRCFNRLNIRPTVLMGGNTTNDIFEIEQYTKFADVLITTVDGSLGEKGFVTDHSFLKEKSSEFDFIYTCGPEPMMRAVARYAFQNNIPCEVSLENTMACGIGACLCCVTDTKNGHVCVCTEGPVFNSNTLKWNLNPVF